MLDADEMVASLAYPDQFVSLAWMAAPSRFAGIGPDEIVHRYLTPKWAFLPTSGAGAAIDGGRFNRPGVEALYLSQAPQTALEEYKQGASISPPATLAGYKITLTEVAFRRGSIQMVGTAPGENGVVPGARSPASTEKRHRRGSWRTK